MDNGIKSRILKVLWEQFADAGNELLANQISNDYLMPLAKDMKDNELISSLNTFKRLSLGEVAPNFSFELQSGADKTSSSVKDLEGWQNYIILFWSSTCGHCLEEIPQLYAYLESEDKKDIKVIAVGLEDNSFRWRTEKMKYPDFIHVLGLGKWQNYISNSYNVTETPSYFLLDSDKKIIGKPFDFSELKKLLETQK